MTGTSPLVWVKTHQKQAGLGAAGVVALLALRARAAANGSSGGLLGSITGAGSSAGTTGADVAGLSGTPNTTLTDMQNQLQDQLNTFAGQLQSSLNSQIAAIPAGPAGPAGAPGTPAPAPRPAPKPTAPPGRRPAPPPSSAHLRAIYDNDLNHERSAQKQFAAAPNAANRKLVATYTADASKDRNIYESSLPKAVRK